MSIPTPAAIPRVLPLLLCLATICGERLPSQLVPKGISQRQSPSQPTQLTGTWQGTATEPGADGQSIKYGLEMRFSGSDTDLRLAVQATAKVPTGNGQSVTVNITASYLGTCRDAQLRMRSENIVVRIVETGETVPSSPQVVEGKLENGVLTGRVGGEQDGWTTFTVRSTAATAERRDVEPAATLGFTGRWRGTCREPGPQGELNYPITVQFSGNGTELQAAVSADLEYPTEDGRSTPVEYRATFRGSSTGMQMQLRSREVRIRLPKLQRDEPGPQQDMTGRIEQGVLRARIGTGGQSDSVLELRPDPGSKDSQPEPTHTPRERETSPRDPGTERIEDTSGEKPPEASKTTPKDTGPTPYPTLVLERQEVRDPAMANVTSHTMLVPKGWTFRSAVQWTNNSDILVNFTGDVTGPAGESLRFDRSRQFTYQTTSSQLGQTDENNGQEKPDGSVARKSPRGPGEVAIEVILKDLRPRATGMRLVDAARQPDLEDKVRKANATQLAMMDQLSQNSRQGGQVASDSSTWLVVERSRVRYQEQGTEWEEEVRCTIIGMHSSVRSELMTAENGFWMLSDVHTARAPAGKLDASLPLLWTLKSALQPTPRWSAAVAEVRLAIGEVQVANARANLEATRRRGEELARSRAELSDQQMQSWRSQQDSLDRVHRATIQSIRGVNDFRDTDGNLHTVTNHYDRAFVNPKGNIILTNDPNYRPQGDAQVNEVRWDEMQRVDPFR